MTGGISVEFKDGGKIFSRAAFEKSDTLLPITPPLTWMGLAAIVLLLFSVILWSIFGAFTVKAEGMGSIIIDRRPPIEKVFYKLSQWLINS